MSQIPSFLCIERSNLDLMFQDGGRMSLEEVLVDSHIQDGDNFLRVAYQLLTELSIELFQMSKVHI